LIIVSIVGFDVILTFPSGKSSIIISTLAKFPPHLFWLISTLV
jgi:hypothetical protein